MTMFKQVLNLDCCIESRIGKLCVKGTSNTQCMCGSIEKVGIAKSDVANAFCHLSSDICQHNLGRYSKETSVIDWCNWTMKTGMFASACCFGISGKHLF